MRALVLLRINQQTTFEVPSFTINKEPIKMPFGIMSGLDPTNSVLREGDDPQKGRGIFFGETCAQQA